MTDHWLYVRNTPPPWWVVLAETVVLVALLPVLLPLFLVEDLLWGYRNRKLERGEADD